MLISFATWGKGRSGAGRETMSGARAESFPQAIAAGRKRTNDLWKFESAPLRQCQNAVLVTDISIHEFDAPVNVFVNVPVEERSKTLRAVVLCLDLNGNEAICGTAFPPSSAGSHKQRKQATANHLSSCHRSTPLGRQR